MPKILASLSYVANTVINGTIPFIRFRCSKEDATGHFGHVMLLAPLYLFRQDNQNEVQHKFLGHVMALMLVSLSHDAKCHQWHHSIC